MQLKISIERLPSSVNKLSLLLVPAVLTITLLSSCGPRDSKSTDWPEYLGGPDRNHYSALTQIDSSNVKDLAVAWEYHAGDSGQVQCNPIIVNNILYAVTAS